MVNGKEKTYKTFRLNIFLTMGVGLFIAAISGVLSMFQGEPFLTPLWGDVEFPFIGALGTPLLFDIGIYILVIGVVLKVALALIQK